MRARQQQAGGLDLVRESPACDSQGRKLYYMFTVVLHCKYRRVLCTRELRGTSSGSGGSW